MKSIYNNDDARQPPNSCMLNDNTRHNANNNNTNTNSNSNSNSNNNNYHSANNSNNSNNNNRSSSSSSSNDFNNDADYNDADARHADNYHLHDYNAYDEVTLSSPTLSYTEKKRFLSSPTSTTASLASLTSLQSTTAAVSVAATATATATAAATPPHRSIGMPSRLRLRQRQRRTAQTSTYETLQPPFRYDKQRGRWSSALDFYFACTSHAFGSITFSELPVYGLLQCGVYFLPAYLIAILFYAIPVFAIQTFLGQFSTSGTISAFRVAPLFKGIGYSILLLNLTSLTYYSVITAFPLIYAANSLRSVIPWMSCGNSWNSPNCSTHSQYDEEEDYEYRHATVEYFRHIIRTNDASNAELSLSWPILYGVIGIWLVTLAILLKRVSFIGKFFRITCILMLSFFLAIFVHLIIHVGFTWSDLWDYFNPTITSTKTIILTSLRAASLLATWLLGSGWGSVITLASHNTFRRDSERLTYWVSLTHVLLTLLAMICGRIALDHFEDHVGLFHYHVEEEHFMQFLYLCFAYLFGSFTSLPNFWSFLFFGMLFIAELSAVIIQMMTVLTAIFDEYERLRTRKTQLTIALVTLLMGCSMYFCTKQGFDHLDVLPTLALLTHTIISLVLLVMTTWIYGRERFQCDLQFMLGKTISNLKIFLIRFVTPQFLVICILQIAYFLEENEPPSMMLMLTQGSVYLIAFVYMADQLWRTNGSLRNRLKQCFAPHDWHPVDADNRRFYEEVMGISEMLVILDRDRDEHHYADASDA